MSSARGLPRSLLILLTVATVIVVLGNRTRTHAEGGDVAWTELVNVSVAGNTLQKSTGCDGCDDGGAISTQQLEAGDGYVEFTVGEMNTMWLAGLSHGNSGTGYADIDFAFFFNGGGYAEIRENGAYQWDTSYAAGDVFRVAVVGGRVHYFKNGNFLRESSTAPQYPLLLDSSLLTIGATINGAVLRLAEPPPSGGGVLETSGSPQLRAPFTLAQIQQFLPANGLRGAFTFPAPYNTDAVRLTDATDCDAGQDCLWGAGYSYWRNMNNHVGQPEMYIFLGTDRSRGGSGPTLFRYVKATDEVQNVGPLFSAASPYSYATGEGWYFSGTQPTRLYTFLVGSTRLYRYDVVARQFESAPVFDLARCQKPRVCRADAAYITQPHSSDDDRVHSATVQNRDWQRIGCVVYNSATAQFRYFQTPRSHQMDECHVDKSGNWLVIIELNASFVRFNRIVNLRTGTITVIDQYQGALGHLDMGHGYAVGADTFSSLPNATTLLQFPLATTMRPIGPVVHYNKRWDLAAANHVAHGNAVNGPAASQYACGSNAGRTTDMADEIVCFSLDPNRRPDGSLDVLVVGQVLTDLDTAGGSGSDYEKLPKGNLDVTGRYFLWTSNLRGDRLDAFIVKVPFERLQ